MEEILGRKVRVWIKLIPEICVEILKKTPINSIRRVNAEMRIRT
jgi:hypothetical protein